MRSLKRLFFSSPLYRDARERIEDGVHTIRITWGRVGYAWEKCDGRASSECGSIEGGGSRGEHRVCGGGVVGLVKEEWRMFSVAEEVGRERQGKLGEGRVFTVCLL